MLSKKEVGASQSNCKKIKIFNFKINNKTDKEKFRTCDFIKGMYKVLSLLYNIDLIKLNNYYFIFKKKNIIMVVLKDLKAKNIKIKKYNFHNCLSIFYWLGWGRKVVFSD